VTETTLRLALCIVTFLVSASGCVGRMPGGLAGPEVVRQSRPTGTSELARQSEFVGFIDAFPLAENPRTAWKQWIFVYSVDPLKGDLGRGTGTNRYPYIGADHRGFPGYPTWFGGFPHERARGVKSEIPVSYSPESTFLISVRAGRRGSRVRPPSRCRN
jgi:hypothetical protein